jgi:hypothetical protein
VPIAVAFIRILDKETLIGLGATEMFLYKVDNVKLLDKQTYLNYAATKRERRSHAPESELASISIHIATLSTNFTSDQHILALLKCSDKKAIAEAIKHLSGISSNFSIFLPRFLSNLFNKLGTDDDFDRKVFGCVNMLFKRSEYLLEHDLKKVVDSQLISMNNPNVYGTFFELLNTYILPTNSSNDDIVFSIDTIRGSPKMVKLIIVSASSDPKLINYERDTSINNSVLQHLNSKFTLLLNNILSTLRNTKLADHQMIQLNQ